MVRPAQHDDSLDLPPRIARIKDARQRILARYIGRVCDLFFAGLAEVPPTKRLVDRGRGETAPERVRNTMRLYALGGVFRLGQAMDIRNHDLHGRTGGRTEVPELRDLHHTSCLQAALAFDALVEDAGTMGRAVATEWRRIRDEAVGEVEALRETEAA